MIKVFPLLIFFIGMLHAQETTSNIKETSLHVKLFIDNEECENEIFFNIFKSTVDSTSLIRVSAYSLRAPIYLYDFPIKLLDEFLEMYVYVISDSDCSRSCYEVLKGEILGESIVTTMIKGGNCPTKNDISVVLL